MPQPGQTFRDCNDGYPEMVVIPAGRFTMGAPANEIDDSEIEKILSSSWRPQHTVQIAQPFAVGKFEITFAEWDACLNDKGCKHNPEAPWGRGRQPVIHVSWDDAKEYVAWLANKTGKSYRLLTEAEWEYAARAGTSTRFHTGRTITTKHANFDGSVALFGVARGIDRRRTSDVGSFPPNQFGLHDMLGNVEEWVEDCHHSDYNGAPSEGSAWITRCKMTERVTRGGAWSLNARALLSANRSGTLIISRLNYLGFRVARTL